MTSRDNWIVRARRSHRRFVLAVDRERTRFARWLDLQAVARAVRRRVRVRR